jgi:hypothetical protein
MTTAALSQDILIASRIHLAVLDEFIGVVQRKLDTTVNSFAQDSLKDLMANLVEQREDYSAMVEPLAAAA